MGKTLFNAAAGAAVMILILIAVMMEGTKYAEYRGEQRR